jgi:YD repeat-containing protein
MRINPAQAYLTVTAVPVDLDASYAWDNEGRMTSLTGPSNATPETYSYDAMGRLSTGGATYGPAGELLTFNGVNRTYNVLGQLTRMTKSGVMDMEYRYTAGQNNGRISQSKDWVTGEEVTYQYDALNRLSSAQTTDSAWGNAYSYDGWGNLTGKSVTKGSAPSLGVSYDPALNMQVGSNPPSYMPPGWAQAYDGEDRPLQRKAEMWTYPWNGQGIVSNVTYDHTGKKVFWVGGTTIDEDQLRVCEIYFYGSRGRSWRGISAGTGRMRRGSRSGIGG